MELFATVTETPQRSSLCISTETPEVVHMCTYTETQPCVWRGFVYIHTNLTEEKYDHIRRNSRSFSFAYTPRKSALCVEQVCVRPQKLHRGEIWHFRRNSRKFLLTYMYIHRYFCVSFGNINTLTMLAYFGVLWTYA